MKVKKFIVDGQTIEVGGSGGVSLTEITWTELKELKDNNELVPGSMYRITDFVTTTDELGSISAGHRFDIIISALGTSELSEKAFACKHEFTEEELAEYSEREIHYFDNTNLGAWELKYSFENDEDRFGWASNREETATVVIPQRLHILTDNYGNVEYVYDSIENGEVKYIPTSTSDYNDVFFFMTTNISTTSEFEKDFRMSKDMSYSGNSSISLVSGACVESTEGTSLQYNVYPGKGVIYYMKDEWGNEAGYDFKNIMFLKDGQYMYTFSMANPENVIAVPQLYDKNIWWYFGWEGTQGLFDKYIDPNCPRVNPFDSPLYFELVSINSKEIPGKPIKFIQRSWGLYREYCIYISSLQVPMGGMNINQDYYGMDFQDLWTNGTSLVNLTRDHESQVGSSYITSIEGKPNNFSYLDTENIILDASLSDLNLVHHNKIADNYIYTNDTYEVECSQILRTDVESEIRHLPFNIFYGTHNYNNTLGINNRANMFWGFCNDNVLKNNCYFNVFNGSNYSNVLGFGCQQNKLCTMTASNTFKDYCINNLIQCLSSSNEFGYGCHAINMGVHNTNIIFGDRCEKIHLGPWKGRMLFPSFSINVAFTNDFDNKCDQYYNQSDLVNMLWSSEWEESPVEKFDLNTKLWTDHYMDPTIFVRGDTDYLGRSVTSYSLAYKVFNSTGDGRRDSDCLTYTLPMCDNWATAYYISH